MKKPTAARKTIASTIRAVMIAAGAKRVSPSAYAEIRKVTSRRASSTTTPRIASFSRHRRRT